MANDQTVIDNQKPKDGLGAFIRDTKREIAKVTWPTRKEVGFTTAMIVVFALIAGIFFLMVDTGLGYLVSHLLGMNAS